tara:strand:+ start:7240 stop:7752 length:513 start_codon:yes stop_codon:yes gene_type:complete
MSKALFITVKDLKRKSSLDGSIDPDKLVQYIEVAQDVRIQNYLGGKLYKKLQDIIIDGTITDTAQADYKLLLDEYIKPMLIWYTQSEVLPFLNISFSNGGVFKNTPENSAQVSQEEMSLMIRKVTDTAEFYSRRFIDFMNYNSVLYPEYTSNQDSDMYPDRDYQMSGWVL